MKLRDLKKTNLPDKPGVYFFKKKSTILYIGKATSLKDRVKSYFSNDLIKTRGAFIIDMITQSNDIDFIKTDSVLEALILEAELIKKHRPVYNTKEKDNKSYNFVVITKPTSSKKNDNFPIIQIKRGRELEFKNNTNDYKKVFGPFPSQSQLKEALNIIRKIFPYFTSTSSLASSSSISSHKQRSKLYQQLGLEPDLDNQNRGDAFKEYAKTIRNISFIFQGKKKSLIKQLEKEMKTYAKNREFEKANKIKKQIFSLKHIQDISLIKTENNALTTDFRIESYDVAHMQGSHSVGVMTVIEDGEIKKSNYRKFILRDTKRGDDVGGIKEILIRRLKHDEWKLPNLIVIDGGKAQKNAVNKILKEHNVKIPVVSVVKDERHKPKEILGITKSLYKHEKDILIANNESHRFAIEFYRKKHRKQSLN